VVFYYQPEIDFPSFMCWVDNKMLSLVQAAQNVTATTAASSSPLPDASLLDRFIPGFSIISALFSKYLHLDVGAYLSLVFVLTTVAAAVRLRLEEVLETLQSYFTSSVEVRMNDEVFNYLMYWISQQPFSHHSTRTVASTKTRANSYYSDSDGADSDSDSDDDGADADAQDRDTSDFDAYWSRRVSKDKIKRLRITPAEGQHYFWFRRHRIKLRREQLERRTYGWGMPAEKLHLSCLGRNPAVLKELLLEAQRMYVDRDGDKTIIYRAQRDSGADYDWVRCMARPPRPLSTVVLDDAQKRAFMADVKEYLHPRTRRWYANRGIPCRRGYMFHGPPGTGKSSLCFAAAGAMHLKIYLISLNSRTLNEEALASLFQTLPRRCIVLLEDVDAAGVANKRDEKGDAAEGNAVPAPKPDTNSKDSSSSSNSSNNNNTNKDSDDANKGISLSALLNIIDGVASSEGRILVMTTNHIEKLDAALLRPGRVDLSIAFGYSDREAIKDLFLAIYAPLECELPRKVPAIAASRPSSSSEMSVALSSSEDLSTLADTFADRIPMGEFTPAEIQGFLLFNKKDPMAAIEEAEGWVQGIRERKKEREIAY
jgi:mitochondrial chaperone BCS1